MNNLSSLSSSSVKCFLDRKLSCTGLFPLEGCSLGPSWLLKQGGAGGGAGGGGVGGGGGWGGLLHKLTHISPLRPWVLPAPSGSVGWICRSFHGPLIFKMGLCSGQREVSEKYWPVRERTGSGYQRLPTDTSGYQRLPAVTSGY